MIWFFTRSGEELRVTTRFDNATTEFVVEIEWPDGPAQTERYTDAAEFDARVRHLQNELVEAHWEQAGRPAVLATGWRGPFSRN
jgi:hypothetical protein